MSVELQVGEAGYSFSVAAKFLLHHTRIWDQFQARSWDDYYLRNFQTIYETNQPSREYFLGFKAAGA